MAFGSIAMFATPAHADTIANGNGNGNTDQDSKQQRQRW